MIHPIHYSNVNLSMELNYYYFFPSDLLILSVDMRNWNQSANTVATMRAYWEIPGNIGVKIRNLLMRGPTIVLCLGKQDIKPKIEECVNKVVSLDNQIPLKFKIFLEKPGHNGQEFPRRNLFSNALNNNQRVMKTINCWALHNTQREVK